MTEPVEVNRVQTVTGPVEVDQMGITDAHSHVWIAPPPGLDPHSPVLTDYAAILAELMDYRQAGGGSLIDCQPGIDCGRDGNRLRQLSQASGVQIVASTGFHLPRYYPPDYWLFTASTQAATDHFLRELTETLEDTRQMPEPVRAGFIKIACQESLEKSHRTLIEAAAEASRQTGAALQVHTEKGADAERIANALFDYGLHAKRLILCHMDKRPDFALHESLAVAGIALEYDTFFRLKYQPNKNLWPLLVHMVEAGLEAQVILATDLAEKVYWVHMGGAPGLAGLITQVIPKMHDLGFSDTTIQQLTGHNIAARLAMP